MSSVLCDNCGYRKKVEGHAVCSPCKATIKRRNANRVSKEATAALREIKQDTNIKVLAEARQSKLVQEGVAVTAKLDDVDGKIDSNVNKLTELFGLDSSDEDKPLKRGRSEDKESQARKKSKSPPNEPTVPASSLKDVNLEQLLANLITAIQMESDNIQLAVIKEACDKGYKLLDDKFEDVKQIHDERLALQKLAKDLHQKEKRLIDDGNSALGTLNNLAKALPDISTLSKSNPLTRVEDLISFDKTQPLTPSVAKHMK